VARRAFPICALVAAYALAVLVYALIAHQHRFPNLFPDEMLYGKLSQGFAAGDGLEWRGSGWGLPPLWPVVLSVAWHFGSIPDGYGVARVLTALVASTVVVPVWLLGRVFLGPRLALVPAVLSVGGAWMVVTSYLVSENLAYPLATASLACTVMAVRDVRLRWLGLSVAFAALAALSRTQMLCLPVILLLALVLDVARQPAGARHARAQARPRAFWIGLAVVVTGGLLAFIVDPTLTNYDVLAHDAGIGDVAATAGRHAASTIVMLAFIPVAVVAALMTRASNWRDDAVGPLLVTIVATLVVLYPLLGRFEAWATHGQPVDRYAMYLAPLFLVTMMLAPGRIGWQAALVCSVAVAAALFAVPVTSNYIEQPALYGAQKRLFELGFSGDHLRSALVLAALAIGVAGALLSTRAKGVLVAAALILAVMIAQLWTSQHAEIAVERSAAGRALPSPLDWVDRESNGPVALLAVDKDEPLRGSSDLYTDFFNRDVKYLFVVRASGPGACVVSFGPRGFFVRRGGPCPARWPRDYVVVSGSRHVAFLGGRRLASSGGAVLVRVPRGTPRVP
jgi:Dolichyl-phosphate-mannose-protein mannosyltransferase